MRIVLTHVYSWPEVRRGGERHLHELAAALQDAGHDVSVLTTARSPREGEVLGVPTRWLPQRRLAPTRFGEEAEEVAFGVQALARLALHRFDVWHALGTADAAAAVALSTVRPRLRTAYTELGIPDRSYRASRADSSLHRRVVAGTGAYLCYSEAAGRHLREGWGREPDIVPGGVDLRRFSPAQRRHPSPTLLFSGAVDVPRKNLDLLLEAVAILRAEVPDLELWLAGGGDPSDVIAAAPPAAREAVVHLGPLSDAELAQRYGTAWVTVLPSDLEAFGMALVESLACGTPIVGLNRWGPGEIVTNTLGASCAEDPASLAEACLLALDMTRQSDIAERCRAAAEHYDWRMSIVPQLERIYGSLER